MSIIQINPLESELWHKLVTSQKTTVFHSTKWIEAIANTYDWIPQAYILLDNKGEPTAGITYMMIDDFRGQRIISLPFTDFCDPITPTREQWQILSDQLTAYDLPIKIRCLHNTLLASDNCFQLTNQAYWHRIDAQRDDEEVWNSIHSSARRAVKKAERNGVTVEFRNDKEALDSFFQLHLGVRKYKHHLLSQPYKFFELLWENFIQPNHGTFATAMYDGQVVGSTLYLQWQDTLYYKYSASALDELAVRPTDIIIVESLKYARQQGLDYIDLGLSEMEHDGLVRFKRKYATDEEVVSFYGHKTNISHPDTIQQVNKLFGNLTDILTDESVPDDVTARAGDEMYRFFI